MARASSLSALPVRPEGYTRLLHVMWFGVRIVSVGISDPADLPAGESFTEVAREHARHLDLEAERRNAWLRWDTRVFSLILTYVVPGPAGFVIMGLRLRLASLLWVSIRGLLALA
jgi:hypothetical protein